MKFGKLKKALVAVLAASMVVSNLSGVAFAAEAGDEAAIENSADETKEEATGDEADAISVEAEEEAQVESSDAEEVTEEVTGVETEEVLEEADEVDEVDYSEDEEEEELEEANDEAYVSEGEHNLINDKASIPTYDGISWTTIENNGDHGIKVANGSTLTLNLEKNVESIYIEGCNYGKAGDITLSQTSAKVKKTSGETGIYKPSETGDNAIKGNYTITGAKAGELVITFSATEYIHGITVTYEAEEDESIYDDPVYNWNGSVTSWTPMNETIVGIGLIQNGATALASDGSLYVDTCSAGKFYSRYNEDKGLQKDIQVNSGTKIYVPVTGPGKLSVAMKADCYTINGVAATGMETKDMPVVGQYNEERNRLEVVIELTGSTYITETGISFTPDATISVNSAVTYTGSNQLYVEITGKKDGTSDTLYCVKKVKEGKYAFTGYAGWTYTVDAYDKEGSLYLVTGDKETLSDTVKDMPIIVTDAPYYTLSGTVYVSASDGSALDAATKAEYLEQLGLWFTNDSTEKEFAVEWADDGSYTRKLERNTAYTLNMSDSEYFQLTDATAAAKKVRLTEDKTMDICITEMPKYAVTVEGTLNGEKSDALTSALATASYVFDRLDADHESEKTYTFTGNSAINLIPGAYSVKVKNVGGYNQNLTSNVVITDAAVTKTIDFNNELFTSWNFKSDDYKEAATSGNFNGLLTDASKSKYHNSSYGMVSKGDTIKVPVAGPSTIKVTLGYEWLITCCGVSDNGAKNAGNGQVRTFDYTGDAGYCEITTDASKSSYINSIEVITEESKLEYKEVVYVDQTGKDGAYTTIQAAIDDIENMDRTDDQVVTVKIAPGDYEEQVTVNASNLVLENTAENASIKPINKGVDIEDTSVRITSYYGHGFTYYSMTDGCRYSDEVLKVNKENGYYSYKNPGSGSTDGSYWNSTVKLYGDNITCKGIIFENSFNQYVSKKCANDVLVALSDAKDVAGKERANLPEGSTEVQNKAYVERAAALSIFGKQNYFDNCSFIGRQDTLYSHPEAVTAFNECDIYGGTDYIMGAFSGVMYKCNLVANTDGVTETDTFHVTAIKESNEKSGDAKVTYPGLLLYNCTITSTEPGVNTASTARSNRGDFGRMWEGSPYVVFLNTTIEAANNGASLITLNGWGSGLSGKLNNCYEIGTIEKVEGTKSYRDADCRGNVYASAKDVPSEKKYLMTVENYLGDWDVLTIDSEDDDDDDDAAVSANNLKTISDNAAAVSENNAFANKDKQLSVDGSLAVDENGNVVDTISLNEVVYKKKVQTVTPVSTNGVFTVAAGTKITLPGVVASNKNQTYVVTQTDGKVVDTSIKGQKIKDQIKIAKGVITTKANKKVPYYTFEVSYTVGEQSYYYKVNVQYIGFKKAYAKESLTATACDGTAKTVKVVTLDGDYLPTTSSNSITSAVWTLGSKAETILVPGVKTPVVTKKGYTMAYVTLAADGKSATIETTGAVDVKGKPVTGSVQIVAFAQNAKKMSTKVKIVKAK